MKSSITRNSRGITKAGRILKRLIPRKRLGRRIDHPIGGGIGGTQSSEWHRAGRQGRRIDARRAGG